MGAIAQDAEYLGGVSCAKGLRCGEAYVHPHLAVLSSYGIRERCV